MFKRLIALVALLMLAPCAAQAAEEWVWINGDRDGALYIDVNAVTRDGEVALGWVRMVNRKSEKTTDGRRYTEVLMLTQYNCKSNLVRRQKYVYLNDKEQRLDEAAGPTTWKQIETDSPDVGLSNAICWLSLSQNKDDIRAGTWRSLDRDKTEEISLLLSQIIQVAPDQIMVMTREDFSEYKLLEGIPYKHAIAGTVLDCRKRLAGVVRSDYFLDWNRLVYTQKVPDQTFKLTPIEPGQYAYKMLDELCAAPHVESDSAQDTASSGGISVGTAWATNKGYLVTASHVVTGGKKIDVYQNSQKIGEATVVGNDPANDVAVLKFLPAGGRKLKIIPLADKAGALGKTVFTLGFPAPDVMGQAIKMSAGDISSTSGMQDDARYMQISIPIQQGNSGGPVIGFDGAAVGVVSAKLTRFSDERDALKPENVNYAVKIAYVRPLLEDLPDLQNYTPIKVPATSTEDLIALAREAVFMLVVSQ